MSILYKPVLIESAEQANALPERTTALCANGTGDPAIYEGSCAWYITGDSWTWTAEELLRDGPLVALVPIEAEEEGRSVYTDPDTGEVRHDFFPDRRADGSPVHTHTRLVTPWEEA